MDSLKPWTPVYRTVDGSHLYLLFTGKYRGKQPLFELEEWHILTGIVHTLREFKNKYPNVEWIKRTE
jgi:hypothetical protein